MPRPHALASLVGLLATALVIGSSAAPGQAVQSSRDPGPASASHATDTRLVSPAGARKKPKDPRKKLGLFVDTLMPATQQGAPYDTVIGKKAQALWFGIEYYPTSTVKSTAKAYVQRATKAKKTPMVVVYSIPNRDCGEHSAGGAADGASYKSWVYQLAQGLKGSQPLVILEPDAIPFLAQPGCTDANARLGLLKYATKTLAKAGAWVYLDAGHSDWTPYTGRAAMLKKAGVAYARGISTNVSNFRPLASEKKYAVGLIQQLKRMGVKGVKYIVDTSRNGAANPVSGDVINPTWARIGKPPRLVFQGPFDGTLWVKHPGESDGPVNGGPPSGQWCDLLADRLLNRTGTGTC